MDRKKAIVLLLLMQLLAMLVLGASGCGAKNQSGSGNSSEDKPLIQIKGARGSESIVFTRNESQDPTSAGERQYLITDKPGSSPVKIDTEMFEPVKAPNGNSLAYLPLSSRRTLALYDIDSGSERVFQVADAIEGAVGIGLSELSGFSWAPDGRSVYVCAASAPDSRGIYEPIPFIFRFYLDGGSIQEISLEDPGPDVSGSGGIDGLTSVLAGAVSPSGTRIIVDASWCGDLYQQSVRNIRRIIPEPTAENGQIFPFTLPIWLNDHEIAYIEGPKRDLIKLDVDDGIKTIVLKSTPDMMLGWAPRAAGIFPLACSPEGDRILFPVLTNPEKYWESENCISPLYIINTDGTGLIQITDPGKDGAAWGDTSPCWASR